MSYWGGWRPYVPVWKRRQQAAKAMDKLRRKGANIQPVVIEGRTIANTFWGKAWCEHLEKFSDFENRLPRGRTYVRNGSVCHLDIKEGKIEAKVSGSELYDVKIGIKTLPPAKWKGLRRNCAGQVGSMLELLQGRLSDHVMSIVTDRTNGLFPLPREIDLDCSCPDWAEMCKHVAAVLYGVGARLDRSPDLLFLLRGVDHGELVSEEAAKAVVGRAPKAQGRVLERAALSEVFGIDIDTKGPAPRGVSAARKRSGRSGEDVKRGAADRPARSAGSGAAGPEVFPASLGGSRRAFDRTVARFEKAVQEGFEGRSVGEGPARQYAKSLHRFGQFVETKKGWPQDIGLAGLQAKYLDALRTGRVQAPASELIFARTALNRFGRFLDEHAPR